MHFFHFSVTYYLNSNGSTKFLESIVVFDSFLKGCSNIGFKMLWKFVLWAFTLEANFLQNTYMTSFMDNWHQEFG
jgi:hypothetical protein